MLRKRLQISLLHVAVTITAVPIQGTINRIMIHDLGIPAVIAGLLAALPYLFSPLQVIMGALSDRHPAGGRRRSPYILLGLLLCAGGLALAPRAVYLLAGSPLAGAALCLAAFGAWGIGFNLATVAYFSLAAEQGGPRGGSRTVGLMFSLMIVAIILTSIILGRLLADYSPAVLERSILLVAGAALVIGIAGLVGLEDADAGAAAPKERLSWGRQVRALTADPNNARFFLYLVLLLTAILGQDLLLEPYAAAALHMSVGQTTSLSSLWGTCMLLTLILGGLLEARLGRRRLIIGGSLGVAAALAILISGGLLGNTAAFLLGLAVLGLATGVSTVSNLAVMLDMTSPGRTGLYIGAWGMAESLARLVGNLLGGALRDAVTAASQSPLAGYATVLGIQGALVIASLFILFRTRNLAAWSAVRPVVAAK